MGGPGNTAISQERQVCAPLPLLSGASLIIAVMGITMKMVRFTLGSVCAHGVESVFPLILILSR